MECSFEVVGLILIFPIMFEFQFYRIIICV